MANSKVSMNFSTGKFTDAGLSIKANYIADKMDENSNFPEPIPKVAELRTAINAYISALAKVESGTKEDTVIKNNYRVNLENMLKTLGGYVQTTSGGDEAIILSSGLDVNKKKGTVGQLAKPENLTVKQADNKGAVILTCDVVEYANFYEFEYTEVPVTEASIWTTKTTTKRKIQLNVLTSGKQYAFRVAGAGTDLSRVYSEIATSFIL